MATALTVGLSACGGSATAEDAGGKTVVLTTFPLLADLADHCADEHPEVESIRKVGAEIHVYEPTPGDIRKAAKADLVLDNGLNLEQWFSQFVDDIDVPHAVVSDGVGELSITGDADDGKPNPHAWMSPLNVRIYAENMAEAFSD